MKKRFVCIYDSPIGTLYLSVDEKGKALWCDLVNIGLEVIPSGFSLSWKTRFKKILASFSEFI
jgi:hypothetical protein